MTTHFTNARLINPETGTDNLGSLTVDQGVIVAIDAPAPKGADVVDCGGQCLVPGIVDWGVKICEPVERHKESFRSVGLAAAIPECLSLHSVARGYLDGCDCGSC